MVFIKTAAHTRFIMQCHAFIAEISENDQTSHKEEKTRKLKADLLKLKQLADEYIHVFSKLPNLSTEYNNLQRGIRINMRKLKMLEKQKLKTKAGKIEFKTQPALREKGK